MGIANVHEIAELAVGDENRCVYTVHANGDWGDYRCEMVAEHSGPHAIGLRHHAVPLVNMLSQGCGLDGCLFLPKGER